MGSATWIQSLWKLTKLQTCHLEIKFGKLASGNLLLANMYLANGPTANNM